MQKVFVNAAELEKSAKANYNVPPFIMMENAAKAMADFILNLHPQRCNIQILCGKGNNGADGYALARLLHSNYDISIIQAQSPSSEECIVQQKMYNSLSSNGTGGTDLVEKLNPQIIVDCIYGTGFHGELPDEIKSILDKANNQNCIKIACDIPSGLYFKADYTITMGEQKLSLYSDNAKNVTGQIIVANLGIPREMLESAEETNIFLIEQADLKLPFRKIRAAHKGTYGHTAVFAGEKSGAGIIAATAAMTFGSGLTTLIKTNHSDLEQFKISPELMINKHGKLPEKTSAILIGPGFGLLDEENQQLVTNWFKSAKNPAITLDADIFSLPTEQLVTFLKNLNQVEGAKIILTPHLSEFTKLLKALKNDTQIPDEMLNLSILSSDASLKIKAGQIITELFNKITLVLKSANTFIFCEKDVFIVSDGCQSLAKGGSGDVLAGMISSLLAQGYSAKDAAITACEHHAITAKKIGSEAYNLTPLNLISLL